MGGDELLQPPPATYTQSAAAVTMDVCYNWKLHPSTLNKQPIWSGQTLWCFVVGFSPGFHCIARLVSSASDFQWCRHD